MAHTVSIDDVIVKPLYISNEDYATHEAAGVTSSDRVKPVYIMNYDFLSNVDNLTTTEVDTTKVLNPDGTGGVVWGDDEGGVFSYNVSNGLYGTNNPNTGESYSIQIGFGNDAKSPDTIMIGRGHSLYGANIAGKEAVLIGRNNQASTFNGYEVAIGSNVTAFGAWSIGIGLNAYTFGNSAVVIGHGATNSAQGSVIIGANATETASGRSKVVIGDAANASVAGAVAIGYNATSNHLYNGVSVGKDTTARGNAVSVGYNNYASFGGVSVGHNVNVTNAGGYTVALGRSITGTSNNPSSVAIGNTITIGSGSGGSIVIGPNTSSANGANSGIAIGSGTTVNAPQGTALGAGASVVATHTNSMALGVNVQTTASNSVAIGVSNTNKISFGTWTTSAGALAVTHSLPIEIGGVVYNLLLNQ